jgi:glycosyltransferase involved in cell wall biosynthesis
VSELHLVVPEGVDDPARPSGGNTYARRLRGALADGGWSVHVHEAPGAWPQADVPARRRLQTLVRGIPDGAAVLVDGLVASPAADVLAPQAGRLRLVVLLHMPLVTTTADPDVRRLEGEMLAAADAVIVTSRWSRRELLRAYPLPAERVTVAEPGVDPAPLAPGTQEGGSLLCVAAVIPTKGHDVLLDALATVGDLGWRCACAGSLDRDPAFAQQVRLRAAAAGLGDRVRWLGPQVGGDLDRLYAGADLLVLGSRSETYGMVITEALARGLPVIAAQAGGVAEALGHAPGGARPGLLVPPGDAQALGAALREWLGDAGLRTRMRAAARARRGSLAGWAQTAAVVARVARGAG